ncbi:cucumber peeling cupredoxin [Ricinus communis]|uniref:Cucumber peeling cupredoxin, putative n=1 Tax=Ricinus communis TaxID=3988 RepID=B9RL14_RICCO|nr:cucumber peeling cupredoxin [Ricinus communis]EEF47929.1 Cucumber peeling cupredoxin, putative [Ricinus communis]|eukprot:XP_002514433.1 cucumber peeling cupredoxin [Ricinus communis]
MALQRELSIALYVIVAISSFDASFGLRYTVGDAVWSIPISANFYSNWSSSIVFYLGDSLVFDFESELSNVIQVPKQDYENCITHNPSKILTVGPAIIVLNEEGVFYYICNISNYCDLGQKLTIVVHKHSIDYPPTPSPSPSPLPLPPPHVLPSLAPEPSLGNGQGTNMSGSPMVLDTTIAPSPVMNDNSNGVSGENRMRSLGVIIISSGLTFRLAL